MAPKFTRTTIPEKETLGEKLAKKRAALGFDIKEAERATRIRATHIEALEGGKYDKLPPDVFVFGFLKNYSAFLKLDPEKVIKLYKKEKGLVDNVKKVVSKVPEKKQIKKRKAPKVLITPKRITIGSIVAATLAIVVYFLWQVSILAAPPKLEITKPGNGTVVKESSVVVEGITDPGAKVFINDFPIEPDPDGNFKEKVTLTDGNNVIRIKAEKENVKQKTEKQVEVRADLKEISSAASQEKNTLEMRIDFGPNPSSVFIEVDGKPLSEKNLEMAPGSSQAVSAKETIVITSTDGGSARINLNGKDLGLLGESGVKVTKKVFNKDSI